MTDSFTSTLENSVSEPERSGRKRKKTTEPECNAVFVDAVQSLGKLTNSMMQSRQQKTSDESDPDWYFLKSLHFKLKEVPEGREKELFKVKMQTELMTLLYGGVTSCLPQEAPRRIPVVLYRAPPNPNPPKMI